MSNFERQSNLHRRGPAPIRDDGRNNEFSKVIDLLGPFADIKLPKDAPQPILSPSIKLAMAELKEAIQHREELDAIGEKAPRTILLEGPPGCGKTVFCHFFSAWLRLPLALIRSESLIDCFLGSTGKNLGALFEAMAKTQGEVNIFFDEIDSIGTKRENGPGATQERASSLNVLLRRIEMFNGIFFAATNRVEALDPALLRRFDMQVHFGKPDVDDIFSIIRLYAAPFEPNDDDTDLMAELLAGATPAIIEKVIRAIKRSSVLWPKIRGGQSNAVDIIEHVLTSVTSASDAGKQPLLWSDKERSLRRLSTMQWPWPLRGEA
jgi:MoxR-like ATPase